MHKKRSSFDEGGVIRGGGGGAEGGSGTLLTGLSTPKPSSLEKSWNVVLHGGAGLGLQ